MSFFDFFKAQQPQPNEPAPGVSNEPIILRVGDGNEVEVPAAEARESTISNLFAKYADVLGIDPDEVNRYTDSGRIVGGSTTPNPGRVYTGSANSFTKG